jgi:hypothetical protein
MKRIRPLLIAAAVVLVAPLQLVAQQGGQGRPGGGTMGARQLVEQGSVEFLVTKAADLQLTQEQTTDLTAIGTAWAEATKEDRAKLAAELPQPGQGGGGDMQAMRDRLQSLMPVMQKVREADEKAVADALKLLNETQQAAAKKLLEERRPQGRGPRG